MYHFYDGYHWMGMHLFWWAFWILFLVVVFGWFEPVPRNRRRTDTQR